MEFLDDPFSTYSVLDDSSTECQCHSGEELTQDRIFYDDEDEVLNKLLSGNTTHFSGDAALVNDIAQVVEVQCKQDLNEIRDVAQKALDGRQNDSLGTAVLSAKAANRKLEEALFRPIMNIIDTIDRALSERLGGRKRKHYRQFVCTGDRLHNDTPLVYPQDSNLADHLADASAFRCGAPAFSVVERPRPLNGSALLKRSPAKSKPAEVRHLVSYMVVKNCIFDAPSLPLGQVHGNTVTALSEAAEHARSLLACLPFQLYVYGVVLCGGAFWLTWTDRAGLVLSRQHSLLDGGHGAGLRTFVRVVLRLTWELSPAELGQDPNTAYVEGHKSLNRRGGDHPGLFVKMGGPGSEGGSGNWTTLGNPVKLPHALFGRGTSVWRVRNEKGHLAVLKTVWTPVDRTSDLAIYRRMKEIMERAKVTIPGIVRLDSIVGGDVHLRMPVKGTSDHGGTPWHAAVPMTVSALRPQNTVPPKMVEVQLHRVISTDLGKPLWKYQCAEELVRAMRMALVAHRDLCALGILHRNINADNILIRLRPESDLEPADVRVQKTEGFLTDFEFAALPRSESEEGPRTAPYESKDIEGTSVFMASSLLKSIKDANAAPEQEAAAIDIPRTDAHDVESFAWVFLFAVYKHALDDAAALSRMGRIHRQGLQKEFEELFPLVVARSSTRSQAAEAVLTARLSLFSRDGYQHIVAYIVNYHRLRPGDSEGHRACFASLFRVIRNRFLARHYPTGEDDTENSVVQYAIEELGADLHHLVRPRPPPPPFTHEAVLTVFDAWLTFIAKGT